nr:unnamed protein product [Callosobruchus analis]
MFLCGDQVELRAASPEEEEQHRLIAEYCQSLDGGGGGRGGHGGQMVPPSPGQLMMGVAEGVRAAAEGRPADALPTATADSRPDGSP